MRGKAIRADNILEVVHLCGSGKVFPLKATLRLTLERLSRNPFRINRGSPAGIDARSVAQGLRGGKRVNLTRAKRPFEPDPVSSWRRDGVFNLPWSD